MAKRKAAKATRRTSGKSRGARAGGRKAAGRRASARKTAGRKRSAGGRKRQAPAAKRSKRPGKKAATTRPRAPRAAKSASSKKTASATARKRSRSTPDKVTVAARKVVVRTTATPAGTRRQAIPVMRRPPALDRERRVVREEDDLIESTPPSSLDLDRSASAVRTGRRILREKYEAHTETSPALTGGDIDADWESAYSVGDEAPGGDNPTPDQDIVDDIGKAVGVEYQDNEELKSEEKIIERDRHRWELDPASSDDWDDR